MSTTDGLFHGIAEEIARAVESGDAARVAELATPDVVNATGRGGPTLAMVAVRLQQVEALRALLAAGADPAIADDSGNTAVHWATAAPNPELLRALLEHGADPNLANPVTGERPLSVALTSNRPDAFDVLLENGADPNQTDNQGSTALHRAALVDDAGRALDLLEHGADPSARDAQGATFQDYLWLTSLSMYQGTALADRLRIQNWLRMHRVAVTEPSRS